MRLTSLTVTTLASLSVHTLAFAPNANGAARTPLAVSMASNNQNEFSLSMDQAKNGLLSVFAASMIFLGPVPAIIEPANAAAPAAPAQTSTKVAAPVQTSTKVAPVPAAKTKEVVKPFDPLATEKANVEAAKSRFAAASSALTKAKKSLADANSAFSKAENVAESAEKKVVSSKKALIAANDKLADAKAKEGANGGNLSALKEVENLASKVGK